MAIDKATAAARPLQGEYSNHHPASAVPDREVKSGPDTVAAGANPIAKTDYADGTAQAAPKSE